MTELDYALEAWVGGYDEELTTPAPESMMRKAIT